MPSVSTVTSLLVDEMLLLWYVNWSTNFRSLAHGVEMVPFCLKHMHFVLLTLPRLCTLNMHRFNKRKWFHIKKIRKRQYPAKTITVTDANYIQYLALFVNTPAQAESLLHSLEQIAGGIGLHVNTNKMVSTVTISEVLN